MPAFDPIALDAFAAVDETFAEDFVVRPYWTPNPNGPEQPDPARDAVRLAGVWREKPSNPREPNAWDQREYRRPGVESVVPHVEFSPAALACLVGFELRPGDHVERCSSRTEYVARTPTWSPSGLMSVPLNLIGARA